MSPSALNRIAWIASLALGMSLVAIFFWSEEEFISIFFGVILGWAIKGIFLPKSSFYPEKRVRKESLDPAEKVSKIEEPRPKYVEKVERPVKKIERVPEKPKEPGFLVRFFAENTLAKVGGLLIFVAIIAFLSVIYTQIGPVGRLIISISVSLGIYLFGVWLARKKDYLHEAQIILGVGVVAAYLSILYIFRVPVFVESFGPGLPYIILGLLTVAVIWGSITGMIFGASSLFAFSVAIAYVNPYLLNVDLTLVQHLAYVTLITLGALVTSSYLIRNKREKLATTLLHIAFWGSMITLFFIDKRTTLELNITLCVLLLITTTTTGVARKLTDTAHFSTFLTGGSISLFLTLFGIDFVNAGASLMLGLCVIGIMSLLFSERKRVGQGTLVILFFLPLIIWITGYILGVFDRFGVEAFGVMVLIYSVFFVMFEVIPLWLTSTLFALLGIAGLFFAPGLVETIPLSSRYILMGIGGFLFVFGHYFTLKRNISITPTIHTLTSIGMIVINRPGADPSLAISAVSLMALMTAFVSMYAYKRSLLSTFDHICVTLIGAISLVSTLVYFGTVQAHWGILLGIVLLVVGFVYTLVFMTYLRPDAKTAPHITITFLGIALSMVTLAIGYLFTDNESMKTLAWLVEAGLLFGMYGKYPYISIQVGAILVQIIGMTQFIVLGPTIPADMILYMIVGLLLFWNILSLHDKSMRATWASEVVLFVSMCVWYWFLLNTLDIDAHWSAIGLTVVSELILLTNIFLQSISFKKLYFGGLFLFTLSFFSLLIPDLVFEKNIISINWLFLILPFVLLPVQYFVAKKQPHVLTKINWFVVGVGIFITSSTWIHGHFDNQFALTVWWSLWIAALLFIGMTRKVGIVRSMGLLVYLVTLGRIIFVDLGRIFGSSGGSGVYIGIGVIMALGIVSIGLSMLYKKLMGEGALKKDFLFQNK